MLRRLTAKVSVVNKAICRLHVSSRVSSEKTKKTGSMFKGLDFANMDTTEELKDATSGQGLPENTELDALMASARKFSDGKGFKDLKPKELNDMMNQANTFMKKLGISQEEFSKGFMDYQKENMAAKAKAKGVPSKKKIDPKADWECPVCSYIQNPYDATKCSVCKSQKQTAEQEMFADPNKLDPNTVMKGILGENIIGRHSAKGARQRRATGKQQARTDARDGTRFDPREDVDGIDAKEINEIRQIIKNYDDIKSGKKITTAEDFRKGLTDLQTHLKTLEGSMIPGPDGFTPATQLKADATEQEIAERKKEDEKLQAFTDQLERDIKNLPQRASIPKRARGMRTNREIRNLENDSDEPPSQASQPQSSQQK